MKLPTTLAIVTIVCSALVAGCGDLAAAGPASIPDAHTTAPEVFAPAVISASAHDSAPAFAPDGNSVYFGRSSAAQSTILFSSRVDGRWSEPRIAAFSGEWNDMEPAFAPDGSWLAFVSNRPMKPGGKSIEATYNGGPQKGGNIWRVDRRGNGWGEPVRLSDAVNTNTTTFAPSVTGDGSVWFMTTDTKTGKFRLFRSQYRDGAYALAQPLPFSDGTASDVDPAVAADESFVIFGSGRVPKRSIDLFIAFRTGDGWSDPQSMGGGVNSPGSDAEPRLSPDHRTLYFSSERVLPITFPRTQSQASADLARMQSWDNGNYNIWSLSLAPWLDARR
ncbi:TolB family protein [Peristeroidobacter agariperforans]|uniref:TolB family protein n=1 Tax=Peristeroidobacter agariperforans TaxID=268404 RepID=UPI00101D871D|nr:PD40 domain-containing protein [Peristeroidobacter agariperforans]